jgi:hypothetical protein
MNVARAVSRPVVVRTRGCVAHGGSVRLVIPSVLSELIKPFVFLDSFDCDPAQTPGFGWQPRRPSRVCSGRLTTASLPILTRDPPWLSVCSASARLGQLLVQRLDLWHELSEVGQARDGCCATIDW